MSNVEAELICDNPDIYCELPNQNLGNLEPGKSGTIDFYILPSVAGEGNVTVEISYEDEMLQVKKLQIPVHFNAEQELNPIDEPYIDEPIDEPRTSRWYVWPACGVGVIAAAVILIVAIKKKKRKANEQIPDSFDWDDTPTSANASEQR